MKYWIHEKDEKKILWFEGIRGRRDVSALLIGKKVFLSQASVCLGLATGGQRRESLNEGLYRL